MGALSDRTKKSARTPKAVSPVREEQIKQNKDFARECQDRGCDRPGIAGASKEVNDKTYTSTPKGKPEDWTEEEQQKQVIAKKRATKELQDKEPFGNREVRRVAGESAKESRQLVNKKGVNNVWEWLFGKPSPKNDDAIADALEQVDDTDDEPEFLTRAEQIRREQAALKEQLKSSRGGGGSDAIEAVEQLDAIESGEAKADRLFFLEQEAFNRRTEALQLAQLQYQSAPQPAPPPKAQNPGSTTKNLYEEQAMPF